MSKLVNYLSVAFIALVANTFAFGQAEQPAKKNNDFKINWNETFSLYSFNETDIINVHTQFTTNIDENFVGGIALDIFNTSDNDTGLGDLDFFVSNELYKTTCCDADFTLGVNAGVKVPVDGEYSSNNPVFHIGTNLGLKKDEWSVTQGFEYFFVDDYTFDPLLGGFVYDNIVDLTTVVAYDINKDINFGLQLEQKYAESYHAIVLGPTMNFDVNSKLSFNVNVGFSVSDDLPDTNLDNVVGFGLKYQF